MSPLAADKRRFYRHPMSVPVQFQEMQSRPAQAASVDVSGGGICFLCERFLAKGSQLSLKIPVGDKIFSINGQVAYANRVPSLSRFKVGVV